MLDKVRRGWSHVGRCRSTSHVQGEDTDDTRSHHLPGVQLWVGSSLNWSVFQGRLRFLVHAAGWLHYMLLH